MAVKGREFMPVNTKRSRTAALAMFLIVAALAGSGAGAGSSHFIVLPQASPEASPAAPPQAALEGTAKSAEKINGTQNAFTNQAEQNIPAPAGLSQQQAEAGTVKAAPAAVTRVVDGDTVYVSLNGREEKVRLIGVDTPESTTQVEPYGKEAAAYTESRLAGKQVYPELDAGERDKYGRLLAYVWLEKPANDGEAEVRAKMYNAELLLNGCAQVMTVPPNVKYADLFVKLQREARETGKGLWGLPAEVERWPQEAPGTAAQTPPTAWVAFKPHKFHRLDYDGRRGSDLKTNRIPA